MSGAEFAIVIPACNEAEAIGPVLSELKEKLGHPGCVIAVGVNGSTDRTAEVAGAKGVLVAETPKRGYGHGCQAAIDAALERWPGLQAFIFFAADGANDPADIASLIAAYREGCTFVLGTRQGGGGAAVREWQNRFLATVCARLCGFRYSDLGPLRLIQRELFSAMRLQEWTYGWTMEAQIRAVQLGARIREVPVRERPRVAGEQKVSGVSFLQSLRVGWKICAAGIRTVRPRLELDSQHPRRRR